MTCRSSTGDRAKTLDEEEMCVSPKHACVCVCVCVCLLTVL